MPLERNFILLVRELNKKQYTVCNLQHVQRLQSTVHIYIHVQSVYIVEVNTTHVYTL